VLSGSTRDSHGAGQFESLPGEAARQHRATAGSLGGQVSEPVPNKPKATIFYSWQSDLPNATNRGFVQQALADAIKALRVDDTVALEPVLDRDTQGQSGSPNIAETIFRKIDQATVFVADVSIIGAAGDSNRYTPNPNVLVEVGYALKTLGAGRVLLVVNTACGKEEFLPFDLRMRRVLSYDMPVDGQRRDERRLLQSKLEDALRAMLTVVQPPAPPERSLPDLALEAVDRQAPDQSAVIRRYMEWLGARIGELTPDFEGSDAAEMDELLVSAINASSDLVADFGMLAQRVAELGAGDAAGAVYDGFSRILEQYNLPLGFSGPFLQIRFDLAKFLGHELFVTLFGQLIREERWEIVSDLLDREIFVPNPSDGRPRLMPFNEVSEYVKLLDLRSERLTPHRVSVHSDLLNQRHSDGRIAATTPMREFMAADIFLNLRAVADAGVNDHGFDWRPWSMPYMQEPPMFLHRIALRREAERLVRPLGVADIGALRELLARHAPRLGNFFGRRTLWHNPLAQFDPNVIGSR